MWKLTVKTEFYKVQTTSKPAKQEDQMKVISVSEHNLMDKDQFVPEWWKCEGTDHDLNQTTSSNPLFSVRGQNPVELRI